MDTKIHFFSSFLQLNNCKQEMETTWLKFFLVEGCVKQTLGLVLLPKNGFRNQICVLLFLFIIFFLQHKHINQSFPQIRLFTKMIGSISYFAKIFRQDF